MLHTLAIQWMTSPVCLADRAGLRSQGRRAPRGAGQSPVATPLTCGNVQMSDVGLEHGAQQCELLEDGSLPASAGQGRSALYIGRRRAGVPTENPLPRTGRLVACTTMGTTAVAPLATRRRIGQPLRNGEDRSWPDADLPDGTSRRGESSGRLASTAVTSGSPTRSINRSSQGRSHAGHCRHRYVRGPQFTACAEPVLKGPDPVAAQERTAPKADTSPAGPTGLPVTCSGDVLPCWARPGSAVRPLGRIPGKIEPVLLRKQGAQVGA